MLKALPGAKFGKILNYIYMITRVVFGKFCKKRWEKFEKFYLIPKAV